MRNFLAEAPIRDGCRHRPRDRFRPDCRLYSMGFTLDACTHPTQRVKREAADAIGSVIDQAM